MATNILYTYKITELQHYKYIIVLYRTYPVYGCTRIIAAIDTTNQDVFPWHFFLNESGRRVVNYIKKKNLDRALQQSYNNNDSKQRNLKNNRSNKLNYQQWPVGLGPQHAPSNITKTHNHGN